MDNIVVMNSQIMRHIARLNDLCEYIYNIIYFYQLVGSLIQFNNSCFKKLILYMRV